MLEELKTKLVYINKNNKHYVFRCPFCGDSKNPQHGHLHIAIDKPVFRCVRCGTGGHITYLLNELGLKDVELPESFKNTSIKLNSKNNYSVSIPEVNEYEDFIKDYIQKRVGISNISKELNILSFENYKTIFQKLFRTKNEGNLLFFDKGIPFLTHKRKKLILRVLENKRFRYYNYMIEDGRDTYIINNKRDMSSFRKHKTIVIAEGIFDIINQYVHRYVDTPDDAIYVAALNRSFSNAYILARSLSLCYYPNVIILADNDTEDDLYLKTIKYSSVKIYRNKLSKDFGEYDKVQALTSFEKVI